MRTLLASFVLAGWLGHCLAGPPHAQAAAAGVRERPLIHVQGRLVTAKIDAVPLAEVLGEISAQSGIKIVLHGSPQAQVSAEFQALPVDQALRRLIKENLLLLYTPDHHLTEAWILHRSHLSSIGAPAMQAPAQHMPSAERGPFDTLIVRLQGGDAEQRGQAALRLGEFRDERALQPVIASLQEDKDAAVRARAVWALEDLGGQTATAALTAALSGDDDDSVRRRAVDGLAKIGGHQALEPLSRALSEDPDLFVRYGALVSLAEVGGKHTGDFLRQALDDPDELIWAKAQELLALQGNDGRER